MLASNYILGIDIAKEKLDVHCVYNGQERHKTFKNTRQGFEALQTWVQTRASVPFRVCLEATGWYGEEVATFLHEQGHTVHMINPAWIKAFGQSQGKRTKTDKTDSRLIAEYAKSRPDLLVWTPLSPAQRTIQQTHRLMDALKTEKTALLNRLECEILETPLKQALRTLIAAFDTQLNLLEQQLQAVFDRDPHLKQLRDNLMTIKGVGKVTAVGILAELPRLEQFDNARQVVAFAGLNPSERQSGSSVRGKARISRIGSSQLRKLLFMPAISVKTHNEHFASWCAALKKRGKPQMVIVVAVMRKLLHIIYGILKSNTPFNAAKMQKETEA
jgi:transposase